MMGQYTFVEHELGMGKGIVQEYSRGEHIIDSRAEQKFLSSKLMQFE